MKQLLATFAIVLMLTTLVSAGPPLRITFKNSSKLTVTELHVMIAQSEDNWGAERLKGKSVAPGAKIQTLLEDGADKCVVDLKIKVAEGKAFEYRQRLCEDKTFTFRGKL